MITNIILLVLPIPMVIRLQVPRAQKAGLICIFVVGSMGVLPIALSVNGQSSRCSAGPV
jgi:hypothetical protein